MFYAIQASSAGLITAKYSGPNALAAPWIAITQAQFASIVQGSTWSGTAVAAPVAPAPVAPSISQQAATLIAAGLTVSSADTPALNGVYNVQSGVTFGQEDIASEAQFISTYSEFTNGATTDLTWPLQNGTQVIFPTTAEFLAFAKATGQFIAAVKLSVAQNTALPDATATIP